MKRHAGSELVTNDLRRGSSRGAIRYAAAYSAEGRTTEIIIEHEGVGAAVGEKQTEIVRASGFGQGAVHPPDGFIDLGAILETDHHGIQFGPGHGEAN